MNKNKKSVSVVIPALNEEKNIANLLNAILRQSEDVYSLEEIIVISDGSTDNTVGQSKSVHDKRIRVINSSMRIGKSAQLQKVLNVIKTDIVVIFDADIKLANNHTISKLVLPFIDNDNIGLVSGYNELIKSHSFIGQAIRHGFDAYEKIGRIYKDGNNPNTCSGCVMALSKKFAHGVKFPPELFCDDTFLYFSCISKGFRYIYAQDAKVFYTSASTLKEHISQNRRFVSLDPVIEKKFGKLIQEEYYVPARIKYRILIRELLRKPIHSLVIFSINIYCKMTAGGKMRIVNGKWDMAISTKKGLSYE